MNIEVMLILRKLRPISLGCGGLTEQIPHQGLDPQCKFILLDYYLETVDLLILIATAIILKIRQLSQ
jgi:hypothetical protein